MGLLFQPVIGKPHHTVAMPTRCWVVWRQNDYPFAQQMGVSDLTTLMTMPPLRPDTHAPNPHQSQRV